MNWIRYEVTTTHEMSEIVAASLLDLGIEGVQIEDDYSLRLELEANEKSWDYADENLLSAEKGTAKVIFYVAADTDEIVNKQIKEKFSGLEISYAEETDSWWEEWKKYYKPFRSGKKVIVRPVWEDASDIAKQGDIIFSIDPGHVFGSGLHESTAMCIEFLESTINGGESVLDIGCGSGILSVVALLLGAENAVGTDIDTACVDAAVKHAELTNVGQKFSAYCSAQQNLPAYDNEYDVVTANIIADVIISLAPLASRV
ncbi:MAG: 50S ribosomal protein L11 methyltransferase, partial [Clostridiales bacterium]|nr:50S ribosomal protein L11 methyltransferase [Clostridiales bacterium]